MVQKAWAGGFAVLASVSAASGLAVETARRAGLTLAGFARDGGLVTYE
jgi:FdhD protein